MLLIPLVALALVAGRDLVRAREAAAAAPSAVVQPPAPALRVCADPNNLPFSNQRLEGFENRLAELLARELGLATVEYTWWAQRRGFFRNTLNAKLCDVVLGVPAGLDVALTTRPYYRSSYAFVTRAGAPAVRSFDDPSLRRLKVGVQLVGDDGVNTPPAHALSRRGIVGNLVGYSVLGDYRQENPPARIMDAVAAGEVDVAIVWGPLAGYFAKRERRVPLSVVPVTPQLDPPALPLAFDIAVAVRKGDTQLRDRIDAALVRRRAEVNRILDEYGVPRVPGLAAEARR